MCFLQENFTKHCKKKIKKTTESWINNNIYICFLCWKNQIENKILIEL